MTSATIKGWRWLAGGVLAATVLSGGCQSMSNTEGGAVAGGALGAGIGALAGGPRHAGLGALAGGLIGAGTGAIAGRAVDNKEKREAAAQAAAVAQAPPPLSLQDIVQMRNSGISDTVIINQIRTTGSVYHLSSQEIVWLQQQGVSEPVITEMQATAYRPVRQVYSAVPVTQPVYVMPAPPPPPAVGFGVTYVGGRWR
jgi:hypothetical protein